MDLPHRLICIVVALLIASSATGCSSTRGARALDAPVDHGHTFGRRVAGTGQAALLYGRSVHVQPVLRPVSYTLSAGSLALRSLGGSARRLAIGATQMPALDGPVPPVAYAEPMDLEAFEAELDRLTGTRRNSGSLEYLVDGAAYFGRLEAEIDAARESIDIRTYIFDNDDYAVALADRLRRRADDGVRVRVLVDGLGNMHAMQVDAESMPADFRPPISMAAYLQSGSSANMRSVANPWFTGDHTKVTIIDRKLAFVGGMNIGREYRYDWHDMMVAVSGPVVAELQFDNDRAWSRAGPLGEFASLVHNLRGRPEADATGNYPLRVLRTRNFDADIYKAQLAAIRAAQSYIYIQNAYFADDRILYELARARRRGVDVRVIVPEEGNHGPVHASNAVTINRLLEHGIRVFRYPGMTHVKAAVYDGWACLGSANFDKLSLEVNRELNIATSDPEAVAGLLDALFRPDFAVSTELRTPVETGVMAHFAEWLVDELL